MRLCCTLCCIRHAGSGRRVTNSHRAIKGSPSACEQGWNDMTSTNALRWEPVCSFKGKQRGCCGQRSWVRVTQGEGVPVPKGVGRGAPIVGDVGGQKWWGYFTCPDKVCWRNGMWGVREGSRGWLRGLRPAHLEGSWCLWRREDQGRNWLAAGLQSLLLDALRDAPGFPVGDVGRAVECISEDRWEAGIW